MKLTCIFSAIIISTVTLGVANAADAGYGSDIAPISGVTQQHDWSGAYVGGSLGGVVENETLSGVKSFKRGAITGGVHAGYNHQTPDNWVVGVEADGNMVKGKKGVVSLKNHGSLRVRAGRAFDRVLPYVDGGVVVGRIRAGSKTGTHMGYTVGGGIEYALTDNVSTRVSYHYMKLKSRDYMIDGNKQSVGYKGHTIGAGISVKF
ncbi:outer membrane protein [Nitratireductor aestuarii]|uniref:Outer membrane protein n=1 Tax=Nitratireductor aestuarii TaxID=1735103 RepID=A0A916RNN8_9HYPH|nr:outer membrane beta-barrel protein [Nitratireductor aestuarii]GGA64026.1 outer membrane protein [Nitratireductor aestuarii]